MLIARGWVFRSSERPGPGRDSAVTENDVDAIRAARRVTMAPSERAAAKLAEQSKLFVRERIGALFDEGASSRTGSWPMHWRPGSRPTGWSPGVVWSTGGRHWWWPTTRR